MSNLLSPLSTIFLIILLGFTCYRHKIFNKENIEGLELLLFKVIIPAYLFIATYTHNLSELINAKYIISYLVTFSVTAAFTAFIFRNKASMSSIYVRILASGYANAGIYALPIITILLNNPTAAIIGNILQVIIIQPIFIILLSAIKHKEKSLFKKLISTTNNPIIIMPLIGLTLNYLSIQIPFPLENASTQLGSSASGIALFVFGLTLGATKITKNCLNFDLLTITLTKNLLHPMAAGFIGYFLQLEDYWFDSLIIAASSPTAFIIYIISKQFGTDQELVKKTIALSAVISTLSLVFIAMIVA